MSTTAIRGEPMAKKKTEDKGQPKRYGTMVRVTDEFADALQRAASFEKISAAEYATLHLLPLVEKRYREAVFREARRLEGNQS